MACYKDMIFCDYWHECVDALGCQRALTKKVQGEAQKLNIGIAVFTEKPECFKPLKDKK